MIWTKSPIKTLMPQIMTTEAFNMFKTLKTAHGNTKTTTKKLSKRWLGFGLALFGTLSSAVSLAAPTAEEIMQAVIDRDDGHSQYALQTIATCKYRLNNKKIQCVEKPRVKKLEAVTKDAGKDGKDNQSVSIILEPASEKGIGFLQYDYDDDSKDTDQWMYLSALGKIKRIVAGNDNEPKTGTLFGSEFSYEDVERQHISDYQYKILKEEKYAGADCWVIETIPTPEHARSSNYSKSISWIDKSNYIVRKSLSFDRRGRLNKQFTQSNIVNIDGVWVPKKMNMNNVLSKRMSTLKITSINLNVPVKDELLSQRVLTDKAFRESQLTEMRKNVQ